MSRGSIVLLVALVACAEPKPPLLPVTPPAVVESVPIPTSEEAVFEVVQQIYVEAGYPDAAESILTIEDEVLIPYTTVVRIHTPRFLAPALMQPHLAKVSAGFYGKRLATDDREAYLAFMTTLLGHELAHSISIQRDPLGKIDWWEEEKRAMICERPVLLELVKRKIVPSSWIAALDRFDAILLAAAPPGLTLPTDDEARRAMFAIDYVKVLEGMRVATETGAHPSQDSVDRVLALYSTFRLERAKLSPVTLAAQRDTFPAQR